ncbi:MAG: hypothetical protein WCV83_00045 [Candidatus Magasanikbacteria bacterium]|jgi:hypothetical protein
MKLYHGSPNNFSTVQKNQAQQGDNMDVPKDELLDAIYLSPKFEFALAVASMPEGAAHIDDKKHTIEFENPQLFDQEKVVYIYEFDSEAIPPENLKYVDEQQYAVINMPELRPNRITIHKAEEIMRFYELKNLGHSEAKFETRILK